MGVRVGARLRSSPNQNTRVPFTANHAAIYGKCCDFRKFAREYAVVASLGTILANLPRVANTFPHRASRKPIGQSRIG
jgi:hypothetical protein